MYRESRAVSNTYWPELEKPIMSHRQASRGKARVMSNVTKPQTEREMNSNWPLPNWMAKQKPDKAHSQPSSKLANKSYAANQQASKLPAKPARRESERERNRNWPHPAPQPQPQTATPAPPKKMTVAPTPAPTKTPAPVAPPLRLGVAPPAYQVNQHKAGQLAPNFVRNPNPLQVQICPLLCRGVYELVDYDLRVPLDYARRYTPPTAEVPRPSRYLNENDLRQPACFPPRPFMYVTASLAYPPYHPAPGEWLITINHGPAAPHVTVRDVLSTMYEKFHAVPDPKSWQSVEHSDPDLRDVIVKAYKRRCAKRALKLNTSVEEQRSKGIMCLDWLGSTRTYFGGMALVNDGGQSGYEIWDYDFSEQT